MTSTSQGSQLQRVEDSEHDYLNTTFWDVNPLFLLVQDGNAEGFLERFGIRFEAFTATGRITDNQRK